jgi:uncharacterized protein YegP (UPF0339 family)
MTMKFEVSDESGGPTWRLFGGNSQLVAWAGESFASASNATRAADSFKAGASEARFEIYEDAASSWRWRAWRSSSKVATSGEAFSGKYEAQRAADNVQAQAGEATGPSS